jgi:hypothetical protein
VRDDRRDLLRHCGPARAEVEVILTRQRWGIVLVILGTILLACAVKVRSAERRVHQIGGIVPTEATIRPWLQWVGLALVAVGSGLQW